MVINTKKDTHGILSALTDPCVSFSLDYIRSDKGIQPLLHLYIL